MISMLQILSLLLLVNNNANLSGVVVDTKGKPVESVLVSIKGTNKSTYTDSIGEYNINAPEKSDNLKICLSAFGYDNLEISAIKNGKQKITLTEKTFNIRQVSVWSDRYGKIRDYEAQKINVNAFEVYTSPTAFGDMLGVLKIIPGAQSQGNDGRLYVRGGSSDESQVFVDGMMIYNPYTLSQKNVAVRSRFSPHLYEGVALQSGGYGSEYGQALSGILSLNTKNNLDSKIDLDLTSAGLSGSFSNTSEKSGVYFGLAYNDMGPYRKIFKDDYKWKKSYDNLNGDFLWIYNLSKQAIIKTQASYSKSSVGYSYTNIDSLQFNNDFSESFFWVQSTLNCYINSNSRLFLGTNLITDRFSGTDVRYQGDSVKTNVLSNHDKVIYEYRKEKYNYSIGLETFYSRYMQDYVFGHSYNSSVDNLLTSGFCKFEYFPFENMSISLGGRAEYSSVIDKWNISPRLYASYKINENHILSFSAGTYFQNPANDYVKLNKDLDFTKSDNVTLSYAYAKKQSKLQIDAYYKKYEKLITYKEGDLYNTDIGNDGYGHAYGIDFFWKGYVKMLEYWISYSYIDSKRKYLSYENERMPDMISAELLKLDLKYWFSPIKSLIGIGYYIDSGSNCHFRMNGENVLMKTPIRNSLTLNISYLPINNMVIHLACQNVLGSDNVYGYTGSAVSNKFKPVTSLSKQFFYLGVFLTLSRSKNKNQLNNL